MSDPCMVCGAKMPSLFGADLIICIKCERFFHRTTRGRRQICQNRDGKCDVAKQPKKCRACRIKRCLAIGLSSRWLVRHRDVYDFRPTSKVDMSGLCRAISTSPPPAPVYWPPARRVVDPVQFWTSPPRRMLPPCLTSPPHQHQQRVIRFPTPPPTLCSHNPQQQREITVVITPELLQSAPTLNLEFNGQEITVDPPIITACRHQNGHQIMPPVLVTAANAPEAHTVPAALKLDYTKICALYCPHATFTEARKAYDYTVSVIGREMTLEHFKDCRYVPMLSQEALSGEKVTSVMTAPASVCAIQPNSQVEIKLTFKPVEVHVAPESLSVASNIQQKLSEAVNGLGPNGKQANIEQIKAYSTVARYLISGPDRKMMETILRVPAEEKTPKWCSIQLLAMHLNMLTTCLEYFKEFEGMMQNKLVADSLFTLFIIDYLYHLVNKSIPQEHALNDGTKHSTSLLLMGGVEKQVKAFNSLLPLFRSHGFDTTTWVLMRSTVMFDKKHMQRTEYPKLPKHMQIVWQTVDNKGKPVFMERLNRIREVADNFRTFVIQTYNKEKENWTGFAELVETFKPTKSRREISNFRLNYDTVEITGRPSMSNLQRRHPGIKALSRMCELFLSKQDVRLVSVRQQRQQLPDHADDSQQMPRMSAEKVLGVSGTG